MKHQKMDRRIRIERFTETADAMNEPVKTWSELTKLWAEKSDVSDRERVMAQGVGADITTRFRIRWSDVTPLDRIILDGRVYDILGVKEIGRRDGMEITAIARADVAEA